MEIDFVLHFLESIFLQADPFFGDRESFGNGYPPISGMIPSMFAVAGFGVLISLFNSLVRKKMVDQTKFKRVMKEVRAFQKEKMAAFKAKDDAKLAKLNQKSAYINKMNMEVMQMNMRPMMITIVPLFLIFIFVLPYLFFFTVAISPVSLNVIPIDWYLFDITCTKGDVIGVEYEKDAAGEALEDEDGNKIVKEEFFCNHDNEIRLIGWYILSSIAFSGLIMKITKTSMGLD